MILLLQRQIYYHGQILYILKDFQNLKHSLFLVSHEPLAACTLYSRIPCICSVGAIENEITGLVCGTFLAGFLFLLLWLLSVKLDVDMLNCDTLLKRALEQMATWENTCNCCCRVQDWTDTLHEGHIVLTGDWIAGNLSRGFVVCLTVADGYCTSVSKFSVCLLKVYDTIMNKNTRSVCLCVYSLRMFNYMLICWKWLSTNNHDVWQVLM